MIGVYYWPAGNGKNINAMREDRESAYVSAPASLGKVTALRRNSSSSASRAIPKFPGGTSSGAAKAT